MYNLPEDVIGSGSSSRGGGGEGGSVGGYVRTGCGGDSGGGVGAINDRCLDGVSSDTMSIYDGVVVAGGGGGGGDGCGFCTGSSDSMGGVSLSPAVTIEERQPTPSDERMMKDGGE
ncbi:Hypothetical predicted protein [Octopus vulgaris]|uniref:Uncharacterized protein n=1 Tax=Octopus vulgaris TaxID=6645 RepID=A0AA36FAJ0_OCTVU|nr:Hypothetical predicted protein [Octopus vulgaris]